MELNQSKPDKVASGINRFKIYEETRADIKVTELYIASLRSQESMSSNDPELTELVRQKLLRYDAILQEQKRAYNEMLELFHTLAIALPFDDDMKIFIYRYIKRYSIREVASKLSWSEATVKKIIQRIKTKISM